MRKTFFIFAMLMGAALSIQAQTQTEDSKQHDRSKAQESPTNKAQVRPVVYVADPRVLRIGPSTTYLKEGLSVEEVLRVLGEPTDVVESERIATYKFSRASGRVLIAEFENGRLRNSRIEPEKIAARDDGQSR